MVPPLTDERANLAQQEQSLREAMAAPSSTCDHHTHAIVFLYEYPRDPSPDEPECAWIQNAQAARAALVPAALRDKLCPPQLKEWGLD
mgnify:CR=1 FL=1